MYKNKETLAWLMWAILASSLSTVLFHRTSLAVVLDFLIVDLDIKDAVIAGAIGGIYAIIYTIMQVPAGLFADFWGPRKTVTVGMLIAGIGTIIFAYAPSILFAFLGRGLIGVGGSVVFISIMKFQISWFKPSQFITINGFNALAGNMGGLLGATPLALLVIGLGWRGSFFIVGICTIFIALLCWFFVRDNPQDILYNDNERLSSQTNNFINKDVRTTYFKVLKALKSVCKNNHTWIIFFSVFGGAGILLAFTGTWSISYLMQIYDFSRTESANFIMVFIIGKSLSFPLIGFIADKYIKKKNIFIIIFALQIILWTVLIFWNEGKPPINALYPIFFLMGTSFSMMVAVPAFAIEVNDAYYSGTAMSVVNMGPFAGMAFFQPLFGYVLDKKWEGVIAMGVKIYPIEAYRLLFIICLIILVLCFVVSINIKDGSSPKQLVKPKRSDRFQSR